MKHHEIGKLVFDYELYPRGSVDGHHVGSIVAAIEADATLPPLVIDRKSKRIIDGFHRAKAYTRLFGEEHKVACVEKEYKDEAAMFVDAMKFNVVHGRALTPHDKVHCLLLADKFHIEPGVVSATLLLSPERVAELRASRIGAQGVTPIALKSTIRHMAGQQLTQPQVEANDRLSGMRPLFYVNQLMALLENDLVDSSNTQLIEGLAKLHELLTPFARRDAA